MRARAEFPVVAAAMIALAVVMTWPLALHLGTALPGDLADPLLNAFTLAWDADRFTHGLAGLWNAPFFFPQHDTLAFSEHLLGIAVFTAPVQWVTGNAVLAYNLAFIASYALAGFCAFLLARSLWGSRTAAWIAGLAFAAAPHRAMHVSHLQVLMSGWLPLSLWGLHHYFASRSRAGLAVFAVSFVLLSFSCSYLMFYGALPVLVVVLVEVGRRARNRGASGRDYLAIGAELAIAALGIVLSLLPIAAAYLRVRASTGLRRGLGEMALFSARASDFWRIPDALRLWRGHLLPGVPERMLFPGLTVAALALLGIVAAGRALASRRTDREEEEVALKVVPYAIIFVLSVWLACGPRLPGLYGWLVAGVPGFDALRVPARFIVVASLALALLAGRGTSFIAARLSRTAAITLAALVAAAIVVEGYAGPIHLAPFDARQRERSALNAWLKAAPAGAVLELPVAGPAFQPFTTTYQFNTLIHRHPVVNGYSGTGSALQDFLADPASPLVRLVETPDALVGLRLLGVNYLVLHRSEYERWFKWSARPFIETVDAEVGQVDARAEFGDVIAWRLSDSASPPPEPAGTFRRIPPSDFSATASRGSADADLAFDGSIVTRWTTGAPKRGDEWFEVAFARERRPARLVFRTDRHGHSERPLRLLVESVGAAGGLRTLFDGSIVPEVMAAEAGVTDGTVIPLPPQPTRLIRLRQTGSGGTIPWSIVELEILERR